MQKNFISKNINNTKTTVVKNNAEKFANAP